MDTIAGFQGVIVFNRALTKVRAKTPAGAPVVLPGKAAFELYATFGFPLDLTQLMGEENGIEIDVEGFHKA